jgi:hypothetical protein
MKQAMTLPELAQTVKSQKAAKRDFIVNTQALDCLPDGRIMFNYDGHPQMLTPTKPAMRQMGTHCGIPAKYFDRMAEQAPELLAKNLNYWFWEKPSQQMVRTLTENSEHSALRAFLGRTYRPLDNVDCVSATVPLIQRYGGTVESCALTETKLYLKVVIPGTEVEIKADGTKWGAGHDPIHVLRPGLIISNSETGHGSVNIQPGVHERHCSNMMVMSEQSTRKLHVQRGADNAEHVNEYLTDETRAKQDEAFWATIRDLVEAALDGRMFQDRVQAIRETMGQVIPQPQATVELVADKYSLTNDERDSVLDELIQSGEPTRFGLQAAITKMAQGVESYDRSSELERVGGSIIELPTTDWQHLAVAA